MKNVYALILFAFLLNGCGGGAGEFTPTMGQVDASSGRVYPLEPLSCGISDMRQWVEANMLDYYLFYDQVTRQSLSSYTDLNELVIDLRVSPNDRFSYVSDAEQSNAQFNEGIKFGFGHLVAVTASNELRVSHSYAGSPFDSVSINRGDYIETINGGSPFAMTTQEVRDFFGADNVPATMTFGIRSVSGQLRTISLTSTQFPVDTVLEESTIIRNGITTGYLAFDSFLETSAAELDSTFAAFRAENIQELVLDLRYNLGGRVDISNKLASLIIGSEGDGRVFTTFALNDRYDELNESIQFSTETEALDLNRVIVLTTSSTCSASELVINSLRPYMEVVVIGSSTCGKPYGSSGRQACGKQMNALQYEFVNGEGSGGYYNGLAADCAAEDDLGRWLGDPQEGMLSAALDYISAGTCAPVINTLATDGEIEPLDDGSIAGSRSLWRPFESGSALLDR